MGQLQNTEARGPRGLDSGSQDFMKPILSTGRHRRSTFFTEMFSVKKSVFFQNCLSPHPKPLKIIVAFYFSCWLVLASEIHNTLPVSGSPTPRREIPLLSLLTLEMNEFVQSAQVWIQALILPWQAAAAHVQKHYRPFIPANAEPGWWYPPGYLGAQGAASSSSPLLPLNIDVAERIFTIYLLYPKGYTTHHQILSDLRLRNKEPPLTGKAVKPTEVKKMSFLSSASALGEAQSKQTPVISQKQETVLSESTSMTCAALQWQRSAC